MQEWKAREEWLELGELLVQKAGAADGFMDTPRVPDERLVQVGWGVPESRPFELLRLLPT